MSTRKPSPRLEAALAGRYRIQRQIGRGGSAIVYLATDLRHDRSVALKVIHARIEDTVEMDRFLREIRIASNLQHPNILPLLDSGDADGLPFFATPYVEGASLRERLDRTGRLPFDEARAITREIADALAHAHRKGIVHRDVKPGNILLSGGHAILADFGLAKAMKSVEGKGITATGEVSGTVQYMSPEQVHGGGDIDERTDVYSLGCVTYEMLCGEPPFTGRTAWAVAARQMNQPAESLRITRPDIPSATDAVVRRALDKDPARRFGSTSEFADALDRSFESGSLDSTTRKVRADERVVTRPTVAFRRAAAIALATAIVVSAAMWLRRAEPPRLDPQSVMVFPLMDDRPDPPADDAGEQVAIMIGAALDHAEPLRWIDGWDWLSPALRSDMTSWSIRQGLTIAREHGAAHVIDGRIMIQEDSVHLLLRLHKVEDGTLVARSVASGLSAGANLPELGRQAVTRLLPSLIDPDRSVRTDVLSGFEPLAVAAWLQGERAYRRSEFSLALTQFEWAVESDSSMALAAIRGAQAASWTSQPQRALDLIEVALHHSASLPHRQLLLARGLRSYYLGEADAAAEQLREAVSLNPDWSDAWMALGEVYYHLLPTGGSNTDRAEAAFLNARRYDPGFTPPLVHLSELALRRGDRKVADTLTAAFERMNRSSVEAVHLDLMSRCAGSGSGDVRWDEEVARSPLAVLETAIQTGVSGAYPECAVAGFQALAKAGDPEYAWSAFLGLQSSYLATESYEAAHRVILSSLAFEKQQKYLLVAGAIAGAPWSEEAEAAVRSLEPEVGRMSPTQLWSIGTWYGLKGRSEGVAPVEARARAAASADGATPSDSLLADALDAWMALAQRDTASAVARFEELAPVAVSSTLGWGVWESLGAERLTLARLLLARGDYDGVLRVAESFDHPQPLIYLDYLPESLKLRLHAAEALGQDQLAGRFRDRLKRLRLTSPAPTLDRGSVRVP